MEAIPQLYNDLILTVQLCLMGQIKTLSVVVIRHLFSGIFVDAWDSPRHRKSSMSQLDEILLHMCSHL